MKRIAFLCGLVTLCLCAFSYSQGRGGGQRGAAAPNAKANAPVDLTGYWVSVVSEDWRHRMLTPRKGDFESLVLNPEGVRVANMWDLEKDNQGGVQCKAFGVGGIMRQPGRIHITWQDDNTLKLDFDAGTQTRLLHFDRTAVPPAERTWQGFSSALWEGPGVGRGPADDPRVAGGGL